MNFLKDEYEIQQQGIFRNWNYKYEKDIPRQTNGFDCGIFISQYGKCYILENAFNFNQVILLFSLKLI
jgi:Ulp1 family protease